MKLAAVVLAVASVAPAPAFSQSISDSDYVRLDTVSILVPRSSDTTFSLLVRLENKTPANVLTIPLSYAGNPDLEIDTTIVDAEGNQGVTQDTLGLDPAWWLRSSAIDTANHIIMLGYFTLDAFPPSNGPLVRVHFRLKPTVLSDTVFVDSTFFEPGNAIAITDVDATEWTPQFVRGMIGLPLEGPGANGLAVDAPQDQQHIVSASPLVSWTYINSRGLPQTRFEAQCGTDADWTTAEKWASGEVYSANAFATYSGSALAAGSTYFYRVRVYDDSTWSPWSGAQFRMNSPPSSPGPISPSGDVLLFTLTPELSASSASDAEGDPLTYDFEVYQDAGLTSLATSVSGRSDPSWTSATLPDDARYWWRVRASDGYQSGAWSSAPSFWIDGVPELPAPTALVSPPDAGTIERDTIAFVWNHSSDPDPFDTLTYRVQWSTASDFTSPHSIGGLSDTTAVPVDSFITDQLYYWRVFCIDKRSGDSSVSAVRTFTTEPFAGPFVLALAADYPQDQQHIVDHTPVLSWDYAHNKGLPQTTYELQVGTDANWTVAEMWTPGQIASADTSVEYAGTALVNGATYYARARVFDGVHWSLWTETSFHLNSAPGTPSTASPSGSKLLLTLTPLLSANAAADAEGDSLSYDFQVFDDIALTGLAASVSGAPGPSTVTPALADNAQYWWRVRAADGYESGNWSSAASFWVDGVPELPSVPVLLSPANAGVIDRDTTRFVWHASEDPDPFDTLEYRVQYATTPGFSPAVSLSRQGDTLAVPGESLLVSQQYYWRVYCIDKNSGDSSLSASSTFTTEAFPGPFVAQVTVGAPQDPLHLVSANPVIAWSYAHDKAAAETKYEIEVGTDADWAVAEMWKPGVFLGAAQSATYQGISLQDGSSYHVRVRAYGGGHWSLWTETSFRMNSVPTTPAAQSPAGDALVLTLTPTLYVTAATDPEGDPVTYDFEVFGNAGLTMPVASVIGRSVTNWTSPPLPDNAHLWWRVRAADGYEQGAWSAADSFWVDGVPQPPAAPLLILPANSASVPRKGVQFLWHAATDPDPFDTLSYRLDWSTSSVFTPTQSLGGLSDTSVILPDSLDGGQIYYWRVVCFDQRSGDSAVSAVRSFETASVPMPYAQSLSADAPQNQLHITNANPVLTWRYSHDINLPQTGYEIECGTDGDWSAAEMWQPGEQAGSDTTVVYAGAALVDGATYYLRVRVNDGSNWSEWAAASFRMNTPPPAPAAVAPAGDTLVLTLTPILTASSVADVQGDPVSYGFEVYSDSALTALLTSVVGRPAPSWTPAALPDNSRVWWRCRAFDGYEFGAFCPAASCWIDGVPQLPSPPLLISPADASVVSASTPDFIWHVAADVDPFDTLSYRLQYSTDPGFAGAVTLPLQADTTAGSSDTLATGIPYFWRVFCFDLRSADSVTSDVFTFSRGGGGTPGDATGDGSVTASDIIFLVNYVFKGGAPPALLWTGDVNADCSVTASDIIYLVNFVFKGGAPPAVGCA